MALPMNSGYAAQSPNSERRSVSQSSFLSTVWNIAMDEGVACDITPLFRHMSPADFLIGQPSANRKHGIPDRVWQRVCAYFHASKWGPYRRREDVPQQTLFKEHSTVFVSSKLTKSLIAKRVYLEPIPTTKRLYQYLNWTIRINKVAQTMAEMEGRNGRKFLLINVELHSQHGKVLYALCAPNDAKKAAVKPWFMISLMTAPEITKLQ